MVFSFWFQNAKKKCTCYKCKKKIYKHEARCEFENGYLYRRTLVYRFLCMKCANIELKQINKAIEKAKAHQRKFQKEIKTERILEEL
ncbi:hypothetical protein KY343_03575 [Candidatus Woesearchaeota archaeon]|nr:hypothetical protein [Candidatus Woesearchaeota archaeon]